MTETKVKRTVELKRWAREVDRERSRLAKLCREKRAADPLVLTWEEVNRFVLELNRRKQ